MLQKETWQFFRELRENNHKEWFDANRPRYEVAKKDYHKLVGNILEGMKLMDQDLSHLQVKDCVFRINRDIRFSKDKSPYKTHLGIIITPYGRRMDFAGYYVHLDEVEGSFAGGGVYMPPGDVIKKIRKEISTFHEDLSDIVNSETFRKIYGDFDRTPDVLLKKAPKGYDESDPAIEFLKLKSFTATHILIPDLLASPDGEKDIVSVLSELKPLIQFLNRALRD